MKKLLILITALISYWANGRAEEITLFDYQGVPVAYIDADDEDNTVYLWDGTPVCYLVADADKYDLYGFNGEHLGWSQKGLIINHDGYVVGFQKDALSMSTQYEPYKSYKKYKPYKPSRNLLPLCHL